MKQVVAYLQKGLTFLTRLVARPIAVVRRTIIQWRFLRIMEIPWAGWGALTRVADMYRQRAYSRDLFDALGKIAADMAKKKSPEEAIAFLQFIPYASAKIPDADLRKVLGPVGIIAEAGEKAVNRYIVTAPLMTGKIKTPEDLERWARVALAISQARGPAEEFFKMSPTHLEGVPDQAVRSLLDVVLTVAKGQKEIAYDFWKIAPDLLKRTNLQRLRTSATRALDLSAVDKAVALPYLQAIPAVSEKVGEAVEAWTEIGKRIAKRDPQKAMDYFARSAELLLPLQPQEVSTILETCREISEQDASVAHDFFLAAPRLLREPYYEAWKDLGVHILRTDPSLAEAYFLSTYRILQSVPTLGQAVQRFLDLGLKIAKKDIYGEADYFKTVTALLDKKPARIGQALDLGFKVEEFSGHSAVEFLQVVDALFGHVSDADTEEVMRLGARVVEGSVMGAVEFFKSTPKVLQARRGALGEWVALGIQTAGRNTYAGTLYFIYSPYLLAKGHDIGFLRQWVEKGLTCEGEQDLYAHFSSVAGGEGEILR